MMGDLARLRLLLHKHHAMNPESVTPNTMATPVGRPMLAKSPIALY